MRLFLLFLSAQMAGNGIACLVAAVAWHITRPRLVASRLRDLGAYTAELKPC